MKLHRKPERSINGAYQPQHSAGIKLSTAQKIEHLANNRKAMQKIIKKFANGK